MRASSVAPSVARSAVASALDRIEADGRSGIWIEIVDADEALAAAAVVDRRRQAGEHMPLAGTTLAVKGNIDVVGHRTTAGCPSFGEVAGRSARSVEALEAAGAVVIGITNLDQFATGLVGTRSPYGACPNAHWSELVSGGSSSGSAVAVASGLVDLALGTDTAGSGRVPAAANGIIGLKPTRGRWSTLGIVPACRSLDCPSVFARSLPLATAAARVLSDQPLDPADLWRRSGENVSITPGSIRIGVPTAGSLTFAGHERGSSRFSEAVETLTASLRSAGSTVDLVDIDLGPFVAAGRLLYDGAFVAERYEAVGSFVAQGSPDLDPHVRGVIERAADVRAWEVFRDRAELRRLDRLTASTWDRIDVMVVPSAPRIPTVGEVTADPIGTNAMLGTYTNFVNLLDLAALTAPVGPEFVDGPPTSLTLIGRAWSDALLVAIASSVVP